MNIDDPSVLVVDRLPLFDDFRAFVHPSKLGELKLRNGSIVEIRSTSNRSALARIFAAAENVPFGYIQLGRALRLNVDCFLGEFVQVKKAKNCDIAECVVLAPIDDTIAVLTQNEVLYFYRKGQLVKTVQKPHSAVISQLEWSPDGKYIVALSPSSCFLYAYDNP